MRGWRSRRSTSAASSSIERPIVSPVPAVFSISSQVVVGAAFEALLQRGHDPFEPLLEAGALVGADVEDHAFRADPAGDVDGGSRAPQPTCRRSPSSGSPG